MAHRPNLDYGAVLPSDPQAACGTCQMALHVIRNVCNVAPWQVLQPLPRCRLPLLQCQQALSLLQPGA